jgi:hypothetical protein
LEVSFILCSRTNTQIFRGRLTNRKLISQKIKQPDHRPHPVSYKHMFAGYGSCSASDCDAPHNEKTKRLGSSETGKQGEDPAQVRFPVPAIEQ